VGQFDVFSGDVRDPYGVRTAMQDCDVVLHLASFIGIPYSNHSPETYVATSTIVILNVTEARGDTDGYQVTHTANTEVCGSAQLQSRASKIGADQMALAFYRSFGTSVTVIRPVNPSGPRQSARAVSPNVISELASDKGPVQLGSLKLTHVFSFVSDTINGFVSAIGSENTLDRSSTSGAVLRFPSKLLSR